MGRAVYINTSQLGVSFKNCIRKGLLRKRLTAVSEVGAVSTPVSGVAAVEAALVERDALPTVAPQLIRATRQHR